MITQGSTILSYIVVSAVCLPVIIAYLGCNVLLCKEAV